MFSKALMLTALALVALPLSAHADCNARPTSETAYSVAPSDNGGCVVVTNTGAVETVTLPDASTSFPFNITVMVQPDATAISAVPAIVAAVAGTIGGQESNNVAPYQSVTYRSDGTNWRVTSHATAPFFGAGGFVGYTAMSYSLSTVPSHVVVSGTCTASDVVGFDYAATGMATQSFRHTMAAGATCLEDAMRDLGAQFMANATVKAKIGADIVSYANVMQLNATSWGFYYNQSWPFVNDSPTATSFCSPCSTEGVAVRNSGSALEVGSFLGFGRSTLGLGRPPAAGDLIGGLYWCADNTSTACFQRFMTPFYGEAQAVILDPSPSVQTAALQFNFNRFGFTNSGAAGTEFGGVGIGIANPTALLDVSANPLSLPPIVGSGMTVAKFTNKDGLPTVTEVRSYGGAFAGVAAVSGVAARGTSAAPAAVTTGDYLLDLAGKGFDGSAFSATAASIDLQPAGTWTPSDHRSRIIFRRTPAGSTMLGEAARLGDGLAVGTSVEPGAGLINTNSAAFMIGSKTSYNNGAAANAGTITNSPRSGNPTKWIPIDDNGTTRYIPAW